MTQYLEWDYDAGVVREFRRLGECNGCGQCCVACMHYRGYGEKDTGGFDWTMRGAKTNGKGKWGVQRPDDKPEYVIQLIEAISTGRTCTYLMSNQRCWFYKDRPIMCSAFPSVPDEIEYFDLCGFKFEQIGQWPLADCPYPAPEVHQDKELFIAPQPPHAVDGEQLPVDLLISKDISNTVLG